MATEYKPGNEVPASEIYEVIHDKNHTARHEVTAVKGEHFPPCKNLRERRAIRPDAGGNAHQPSRRAQALGFRWGPCRNTTALGHRSSQPFSPVLLATARETGEML